MPKKKKKLKKHSPQKNKPAQTKKEKKSPFGKPKVVTKMIFNQPHRVDINIFIHGGRTRSPIRADHKGNLRRG